MPCDYSIDRERGIVLSRGWGALTDEDLIGHQSLLAEDPDFSPHFNQLYDLREIGNGCKVSSEAIRCLASHNPFSRTSRRAILTSSKIAYGLVRMFQHLADQEPDRFRVIFDEVYLAEEWLNLRGAGASSSLLR